MKKVNKVIKDTKKAFITALIISILFIIGIPVTIFSAINRQFILMAFGIACIVVGFYGTPLIWIHYASLKQLYNVVFAITEEKIFSVSDLCSHFGKNTKDIIGYIETSIEKHYLVGYKFNGKELSYNDDMNKMHITKVGKCPACGAPLEDSNAKICPYCRVGLSDDK
ncbi:MAG: hypothetical protein ACI4T8_02425 [Christensenellales bacterium]